MALTTRTTAIVTAVLVSAGGVLVAPASQAAQPTKYYSSCAKLSKKYPAGVAKNAKAARRAVRAGFSRPATSPAAKRTYFENSSRLDRDGDGVACES